MTGLSYLLLADQPANARVIDVGGMHWDITIESYVNIPFESNVLTPALAEWREQPWFGNPDLAREFADIFNGTGNPNPVFVFDWTFGQEQISGYQNVVTDPGPPPFRETIRVRQNNESIFNYATAKKVDKVPTPLPLLGVGAALGYSRKLRKKIKNSKLPAIMSAIG